MKCYTVYSERKEIVTLHQQGKSYRQIAEQTGWNYFTFRKICRSFRRHGEGILKPKSSGRPATGLLSRFDPKNRFACLKIKRQHLDWRADVVRSELAKRPWALGVCISWA